MEKEIRALKSQLDSSMGFNSYMEENIKLSSTNRILRDDIAALAAKMKALESWETSFNAEVNEDAR